VRIFLQVTESRNGGLFQQGGQGKMSGKNMITVERLPDGRVVQVMTDGSKHLLQDQTDWARLRAMTESEIEAAAVVDLDNPPLTDEELKKFRRVPDLKEIRQKHIGLQLITSGDYHNRDNERCTYAKLFTDSSTSTICFGTNGRSA